MHRTSTFFLDSTNRVLPPTCSSAGNVYWSIAVQTLLGGLASLVLLASQVPAAENAKQIEQRLTEAVKYTSGDDLEGRGVGTDGINKAADYIAEQFSQMGLVTGLFDGHSFQKFTITTDAKLGPDEDNRLEFVAPAAAIEKDADEKDAAENDAPEKNNAVKDASDKQESVACKKVKREKFTLKLNDDFNPLAAGGSGEFNLPLVFAGFGITAEDAKYDDYEGIDVKDKCVIVLRHQPQRDNPHSPLGKDPSHYAFFQSKIANAYSHGAAAIIFCTGQT